MSRNHEGEEAARSPSVALQVVIGAAALAIAWHVSTLAWLCVLVLLAILISRRVTAAWWDARKRRFGRELEARSLADLGRLCKLTKVPFAANVPVSGLGDADAIMGRKPLIVEIKSWRSWDMNDGRCLDAIRQVERLMSRCDAARGLIWLPQGELTFLQHLGFQPGMPNNIRVVVGPAWRPLWKVLFR
jgi:hypothetical protein